MLVCILHNFSIYLYTECNYTWAFKTKTNIFLLIIINRKQMNKPQSLF